MIQFFSTNTKQFQAFTVIVAITKLHDKAQWRDRNTKTVFTYASIEPVSFIIQLYSKGISQLQP